MQEVIGEIARKFGTFLALLEGLQIGSDVYRL